MMDLTTDTLGDVLRDNAKVMVQYGAGWCGNCRLIKPKFKKLSAQHEDVLFVYVDAEKLPGTRAFAEVTNLPTFAGFVNGQLVGQSQGNKIEVIEHVLHEVTHH